MFRRSASEMRTVILAPIGRDAVLLESSLSALQLDTAIAADLPALTELLMEGAGCAIIAEEALTPGSLTTLKAWLAEQPPWSDMPFNAKSCVQRSKSREIFTRRPRPSRA
jgi:hypothetical protein